MLRLSEAFLTNGDFLERVELSLSLRLIWRDKNSTEWKLIHDPPTVHVLVFRRTELLSYPADVLALRSRGEGLGADDGVSPHERVLLVDVRAAFLGPNHRAVVGRQQVVHARLLVHLDKENRRRSQQEGVDRSGEQSLKHARSIIWELF